MEENKELSLPSPHFPTGKREIILLITMAVCGVLLADFICYGGFNLGFALAAMAVSIASYTYLRRSGCKGGGYANALFGLNLIIAASFLRSDDGFVKFVMVCFLLIGGNLSMVLTAGQNRRHPGGLLSLLDAPMAIFSFGLGQLGSAFRGVNEARKNAGTAGKKNMAVLAGLAVAVPVMAVLIPLLIRADAAFEGLVNLLPKMDLSEPFLALLLGIPMACVLYARNAGLMHRPKTEQDSWSPRRFSSLTINTVLICVVAVYGVYLVSQLAYFVGGFSGILPAEFTMAEYARRGFFEMTWLAVINLGIIVAAVALAEPRDSKVPLATRALCLFIGIVTLFFAATASAKMFLYIGSYGLTRLRLLVQVIIIFIALTVVFVAVWLFKPKFSYMKAVLLSAMVIGACVAWADVDTVVAAYNVDAYQSGKLESVDIGHLCALGDGAVPYLEELSQDSDSSIASAALNELHRRAGTGNSDIRAWNMASSAALEILKDYHVEVDDSELADSDTPLRILADYTEMVQASSDLTMHYGKQFREEPYWQLHLKNGLLLWEDGSETEIYLSSTAHFAMDQAGVERLWVSDCYVLFFSPDEDTMMLWTNSPDAAAWRLKEHLGSIVLVPVTDQWYLVQL